jgi:TRAP-type transport system small permease protein
MEVSNSNEPIWLRCIDRVSLAFVGIGALTCLVMAVHVALDVLGRYFLNRSIAGTLEYVTYWWMPVIVFLALGAAQLRGEHIRVTLVLDNLAPASRRVVDALVFIFCTVLAGALVWYSVVGAMQATEIKQAALGLAVVPIWRAKWIAAVGLLALALQSAATVYRILRNPPADNGRSLEDLADSSIPD